LGKEEVKEFRDSLIFYDSDSLPLLFLFQRECVVLKRLKGFLLFLKTKVGKSNSQNQTIINQGYSYYLKSNLILDFFFGERKEGIKQITKIQLSTVDLLARVSMKNVAKCDK
jgi:hypothetical protein